MRTKIILLALLFISPMGLWAQAYLDSTFNASSSTPGKKPADSLQGTLGAITVSQYGKIVSVSYLYQTIHVRRLQFNGSDDASFGNLGYKKITLPDTITVSCVAVQADGKILVGGQRLNYTIRDMYLVRFNQDGTLDNTFDGDGYWTYDFGGNDRLDKIMVQKDNKIVVGGKRGTGIALARLNSDASFDLTFAGSGFITTGSSIQSVGGIETDSDNMIYVAGDSAGFYMRVLKFFSSGTSDNSFGKLGIAREPSGTGIPVGLAVQPDGKILIGGSNSPYSFSCLRFKKSGQVDSTFGTNGRATYSCYYAPMNSMFLHKDGGIIMSGSYNSPGYDYRIMRLQTTGSLDSTFGVNGMVIIPTSTVTSRTVSSPDGKIVVFGKEGTTFVVYKLTNKSAMHILGSTFVSPKSVERYKIEVPASWPVATYQWFYTDATNSQFLPPAGANGSSVFLFFSDNAIDGTLSCKAMSLAGATLGLEKIDIVINRNPSIANQLADLQCDPGVSDCSGSYINYFSLHNIENDSSGCSDNGYSDFTKSNYFDTLAVGGVYSALLKVEGGSGNTYVGIWIDYNNDGDFSSTDEFVAEKTSDVSVIEINNIVFKNQTGYDGPKRLRVRCRSTTGALTASESCQVSSADVGETEDYLIILDKQTQLEAPEIITPNDDGKNDYFVVRGVSPASGNKLTIFDRWGEVRYTADNYQNNWSGIGKNGEKLVPGTYYYLFTNNNQSVKGFLEIRY